jgi:hypothetical protein
MLRRTSGVLVLLFLTLAGADALCAMPCGISGDAPQQGATAGDSHCKTVTNDSPDAAVISSTGGSCGVEHGRMGPAAESASSRWSLASATTPSTPSRLPQDLQTRQAFAIAPDPDASDGSPQAIPPLRI